MGTHFAGPQKVLSTTCLLVHEMSFLSEVYEVLLGLLHPWVFMGLSASWIPHTIKTLFQNRNFDILFSPTRFQDAWFGNFWGWAGPNVKLSAEAKVIPLLEGRTKGGRILNES